VIDASELAD